MWRCICGHAFYSALPPSCPSCDLVVDADVEETVTVDGRKLPFRVWEAEVLVHAAAWAAIVRAVAFIVGAGLAVSSWKVAAVGPLTVGCLLAIAGVNGTRRGVLSRLILVGGSTLAIPGHMGTGAWTAAVGPTVDPILAVGFGICECAIAIFTFFVAVSTSGEWVWEMGGRNEPIAPLSSAWRVNRSIKAWASVGIVALSFVSAALSMLMLTGVGLARP
jgi:hypothetical protein